MNRTKVYHVVKANLFGGVVMTLFGVLFATSATFIVTPLEMLKLVETNSCNVAQLDAATYTIVILASGVLSFLLFRLVDYAVHRALGHDRMVEFNRDKSDSE